MFKKLATKIFGSQHQRTLKKMQPLVEQINALEDGVTRLTDDQLKAETPRLREKLANGATLDDLLPEAFAVVREASRRTLKMRHYDVQLIGGIALHRGIIAEMRTGEGKTLVATLALYLNALEGRGAHLVTVNDYLASRDAEWMGQIYRFLGMSVGVIVSDMDEQDRKAAYEADITYGQNNEFGFDYLRDNMKFELSQFAQRPLRYAIVDEVDSILIDEARTPLIISGPAEESTELYYTVNNVIPFLKREQDYLVDEKSRSVSLTETGVDKVERRLNITNLYDAENMEILHHVNQALKAHTLFKRDVNYLIEDGKVVIVDEFTGRKMAGRRWSDGLHQAVEAKEGLKIQDENQTLATITFQNYFRMYDKLAGMTGTAETEAEEFGKIYKLDVLAIPTNADCIRIDYNDLVYKTQREKVAATVDEIIDCHKRGQPCLVGTVSVEKSEFISTRLRKNNIKHHVLNAKQHGREAEVVAQAGRKGAVTIATNMAGRGTDIILGGNPEMMAKARAAGSEEGETYESALAHFKDLCARERQDVLDAGGLHIIGTERHESRRIDNQLRGRAGRQGDPGSSRFFLSLEDDLLRIFGAERISGIMDRLKMPDGEPIEHKWITKAIESAQVKVEGHNFDIRKNLLDYDDVMNQQRKTIYGLRRKVIEGVETHDLVLDAIEQTVGDLGGRFMPEEVHSEEWDMDGFHDALKQTFRLEESPLNDPGGAARDYDTIMDEVTAETRRLYEEREEQIVRSLAALNPDPELTPEERLQRAESKWRDFERETYLRTIDGLWKNHLLNMDHLREGIYLEAYAQKDPKILYKREGFYLFEQMLHVIREDVASALFKVEVSDESAIARRRRQMPQRMTYGRGSSPGQAPTKPKTFRRAGPKLGRNDPCHCGSGRKYKHCCMGRDRAAAEAG